MKTTLIPMLLAVFYLGSGVNPAIGAESRSAGNSDSMIGMEKPGVFEWVLFDVNQISSWTANDGKISDYNKTGNSGLEWPKGSGRHAVFTAGVWFAGFVNGELRSAAAEYTSEFQAGRIVNGVPDEPGKPEYQIYKINKGDSYQTSEDWRNWPVEHGAPWIDVDGSGTWDPQIDRPKLIGDQTMWFVSNDGNPATHAPLWNTNPLYLELQTTLFGFDRAGPLGNVMFMKWLAVNKGNSPIDSAFVSMWSDPDVGDHGDDWVASDTTRSLGLAYNGVAYDGVYGYKVPAVGYDFFQGPLVPSPGDTGYAAGQEQPGYKNLPMTSFVKYINGHPTFPDPETAEEAYSYMNGLQIGNAPFTDPDGNSTRYVAPVGAYNDQDPPGDRRLMLSSGPFTMDVWNDTDSDGIAEVGEPGVQEIVGACIVGAGTSNRNAINVVQFFDDFAQNAFDAKFNLPSPPAPVVKTRELDQQILLRWDQNAQEMLNYSELGYDFEGVNVYQGESSTGPWELVETFDEVNGTLTITDVTLDVNTGLLLETPVQFGTDEGFQSYILLEGDIIRNNQDLINGRKYYYAVTSYAHAPGKIPRVVESAKSSFTLVPRAEPTLTSEFATEFGEAIQAEHTSGNSDAKVLVQVADPYAITGDTYEVRFQSDSITADSSDNYWQLNNTTAGNQVRDEMPIVPFSRRNEIIDGLFFGIEDAVFELSEKPDSTYQDVNLDERTKIVIGKAADAIGGARWLTQTAIPISTGETVVAELQNNLELRFTEEGQVATRLTPQNLTDDPPPSETVQLPFELWDTENDRQLNAFAMSLATDSDWQYMYTDTVSLPVVLANGDTLTDDNDDFVFEDKVVTKVNLAYLGVVYTEYDSTERYAANDENAGWVLLLDQATTKIDPPDSTGYETVKYEFKNPVLPEEDRYAVQTDTINVGTEIGKEKKDLINVFPNPYMAQNVMETNPLNRFVTFTHLPNECTIRIFTVNGDLIRTLDHGPNGGPFEEWDLRNEHDIPVASGMYIAHLDLGDGLGEKILKLAVFMPEERLDLY